MKITSIRKNKMIIELNQIEEDLLFRAGLQIILDREYSQKVKIFPITNKFEIKKMKTVEFTNEMVRICIEESVNQALKEYIEKYKKEKK